MIFLIVALLNSIALTTSNKEFLIKIISADSIAISVPLSYFSGIGKSSKSGILIKGSDYLDGLKDIKEILVWLKNERDRDILGHGFFNNKDIIMDSFRSGNTIVFKYENKSIGLIVWNESDDILVNVDIFVIQSV